MKYVDLGILDRGEGDVRLCVVEVCLLGGVVVVVLRVLPVRAADYARTLVHVRQRDCKWDGMDGNGVLIHGSEMLCDELFLHAVVILALQVNVAGITRTKY